MEKVQKIAKIGLIVNNPDSIAAKKSVKMYSLEAEIDVPTKPYAEDLLRDDYGLVL